MNSRYRCHQCRYYYPTDEVFYRNALMRLCSSACLNEHLNSRKPKVKPAKKRTPKPTNRLPGQLRLDVVSRDKVCRWCGGKGAEVHHIRYRSEGGPDEPSNLILLCKGCHDRAHSSKQAFKPLLLGCIWEYYVNSRSLSVPEFARALAERGELTELQAERLA